MSPPPLNSSATESVFLTFLAHVEEVHKHANNFNAHGIRNNSYQLVYYLYFRGDNTIETTKSQGALDGKEL